MTTTFRAITAAALAAGALVLTACGSSGSSPAAATTDPAGTGAAASAASTTATAPAGTVSANDATGEELIAAFEAAGIPSADRWAREVQEYRPYDTSDPTLAHLQDELAKYNPDPAVLEKILATLTP